VTTTVKQTAARRRGRRVRVIIILIGLTIAGYAVSRYHGPTPPTEIARGVVYSCVRLPQTGESGGLLHLVRADLNEPGVELFVTPVDADAKAHGWEYRLQYVSSVVHQQRLMAAVNGTLFSSDSGWVRQAGDLARSSETAVADHAVNHVDANTYLLWWDDDRIAHLETTKPPSDEVLAKAKWAIGGQSPTLIDGKSHSWNATNVDHRTMIAADPPRRLLWMAVFDKASARYAATRLAEEGATIGVVVDGGTSSAMAIGSDAHGVRTGTITGGWRPVATVFGVRASSK
jgi:hypothetical protein